jgi:glyoxylase-like metal-dependent hydrolase (beta-lactamase superfamily II)
MTRTVLREGLVQVKIPLPFPLRWVNSYAVRGTEGWTIIDPGLHTSDSEAVWMEALAELGIGLRGGIEQIVLTHHHPDHYGMSGWFQELCGAPVYLSRTGQMQVRELWGDSLPMSERLLSLFLLHGLDRSLTESMLDHMSSFIPQVSPQPKLSVIEPEKSFRLGDRLYRTIHTPGHADGHMSFYNEEHAEIFCGDHVLPQITPNVGYLPGFDVNPLRTYLDNLQEMSKLKVDMAYPGHREPFATYAERALGIVRHHEERLIKMDELLREEPISAYGLCRALFGDKLSIHQLRFALSETIAHVIYMHEEGRLREQQAEDGTFLYRSVTGQQMI